ncbi:MAG: hypothetical protein GY725_01605 [bacterium]|nr:hypothetical protein [bacterium]
MRSARAIGLILAGLSIAMVLPAPPTFAIDVASTLKDVVDRVEGRDLWKATFTLTPDSSTARGDAASVHFARDAGFEELNILGSREAQGWSAVAPVPDPTLPADGAFDAVAIAQVPEPRTVPALPALRVDRTPLLGRSPVVPR